MVSDYISEKLGLPVTDEPSGHVRGQFHRFDDGSCECEVGELLYSLVKIIKPDNILETGSYFGISSCYLALGLKENGKGHLDTLEWEIQHVNQAIPFWQKLGVDNLITSYNMSSMDFTPTKNYQLMLLDTEPQTRFPELDRFWGYLDPGGIVVIHDLSWDMGSGAPQFWKGRELIESKIKSHELTVIHFYTPRGLTVMRRANVSMPDYVYSLLNGKE